MFFPYTFNNFDVTKADQRSLYLILASSLEEKRLCNVILTTGKLFRILIFSGRVEK